MFLILLIAAVASADACNIACTMQWNPVCGTNTVTYGNLCQLESDACLRKQSIAIQHYGECIEARSIGCNNACQMNYSPVCGTDAVTYNNLCQLEADACLKRSGVTVQHVGECTKESTSCNMACQFNREPICGTDGVTYGNKCQLESTACLKKKTIGVQYAGECIQTKEPICQVACQLNYDPVCATNGATFGNLCELEASACLKREAFTLAHHGIC